MLLLIEFGDRASLGHLTVRGSSQRAKKYLGGASFAVFHLLPVFDPRLYTKDRTSL
tara:strand:- start:366 stop:533 length:168 start_codon:yes stop_codon:yes gene_type:complete